MSGLEKILAEIKNDASEVAKTKVEDAQRQADEILDKARKEAEEKKAAAEKEKEIKVQNILDRAESSAEFEKRKTILAKKQELVSKIIKESKDELADLDEKKYFEVLAKLAKNHGIKENATMALCKKDLDRLPDGFVESLGKNITVSKEAADIKTGFLLIYDGINVNCSFDALFAEITEELQDKVASVLFK